MDKELERLENKIDANKEELLNTISQLHNHEERIQKNTGALELLHTINSVKTRYFIMWLFTFGALLNAVGFIIYLLLSR